MILVRLWRPALFCQYAVLVFAACDDARTLGYQLRHDGYYPLGCTAIPLGFTLSWLLVEAIGIVGVLGLLANRPWARWPYAALVAFEVWLLCDAVRSPYLEFDLPTVVLFAMFALSALLLLFFSTSGRASLHHKPA